MLSRLLTTCSRFKSPIDKLKISREFAKFLGFASPKSKNSQAQITIMTHYHNAIEGWSVVTHQIDALNLANGKSPVANSPTEDDLASWLNDMRTDDGVPEVRPERCNHFKIDRSFVALRRCSWCSNVSPIFSECVDLGIPR